MLLIRLVRLARSRDEGAALATVLGLMLVGVLLTTLISASLVSAYGFSSSTRAGVASRSSAEAGIAAARASLVAGTCASGFNATHPSAGVYQSAVGATPEYEAAVYPKVGASWSTTPGCPSSATTPIRIVATGEAQAAGVQGQDAGDETTLEAVYSAPSTPTEIRAVGPAVYAYSAGGFGGGGQLLSTDGVTPDIMVRTGNVYCDGGAGAVANLVVNGNLTITAGCGISGTAWATGTATIDGGGNIYGNVRAYNVVATNGTIWGNIHALNDVSIPSGWPTLKGNITGKNFNITAGGVLSGKVWVYGNSTINNGNYTTTQWVTKTYTKPNWLSVPGLTATSPAVPATSPWEVPAPPIIPTWIDFNYDASQWVGFVEYSMGTDCSRAKMQAAIAFFNGRPGLIDARNCTMSYSSGQDAFEITNDLAIIGKSITLSSNYFKAVGGTHRLWLINPDTVNDDNPDGDCNGQTVNLTGGFTFQGPIEVMVYSPCRIYVGSGITFNGQIFAAETQIAGNAHITYTAVGLPGFDLSTGDSLVTVVTEGDRRLESIRTLSDAG